MASSAGKRSTHPGHSDIFYYSSPALDLEQQQTSSDVKPKTSRGRPPKVKAGSQLNTLVAPPESKAVFADLDSLDELIKKQQQLQELDKRTQAKQLELGSLQTTARPVAAGQNPSYQFSSVPGPASFQDATPIMFLSDSSQAGGPDGSKSLFNLLRPRKIINPQKWPHHYVPFGLSQKTIKNFRCQNLFMVIFPYSLNIQTIHNNICSCLIYVI